MQCTQCHAVIQKSDRFCQFCGAPQEAAASSEAKPKATPKKAKPAPKAKPRRASPEGKTVRRRPPGDDSGRRRRPPRDSGSSARSSRRREGGPRPQRRKEGNGKGMWIGAIAAMLAIAGLVAWQKSDDRARKTISSPPPAQGLASPGGSMAGGAPPMAAEAPRIPSTMDIEGTITLDPSLKDKVPSQGAFFVMARIGSTTKGPPIAAVKLPASDKPTPFVIGPADLMMGGEFNQPVTLQVRWDQDGDPLTRQSTDLVATSGAKAIAPGSKGLKLVLNNVHGTDEAKTPLNLDEPESQPASEPAAAAPAAPAATGNAGGDITGVIRVDPALAASRPSGGLLFVMARTAGSTGGPPVAATRVGPPGPNGEVAFRIGQKDVMMGGPFNQPVLLQVRWDQDGNAMSKQPGDLTGAAAAAIAPGTQKVVITLNQKL